jgi:hypothetical protein
MCNQCDEKPRMVQTILDRQPAGLSASARAASKLGLRTRLNRVTSLGEARRVRTFFPRDRGGSRRRAVGRQQCYFRWRNRKEPPAAKSSLRVHTACTHFGHRPLGQGGQTAAKHSQGAFLLWHRRKSLQKIFLEQSMRCVFGRCFDLAN